MTLDDICNLTPDEILNLPEEEEKEYTYREVMHDIGALLCEIEDPVQINTLMRIARYIRENDENQESEIPDQSND